MTRRIDELIPVTINRADGKVEAFFRYIKNHHGSYCFVAEVKSPRGGHPTPAERAEAVRRIKHGDSKPVITSKPELHRSRR